MWQYLEYIVKRPYYNIIMKSLTLRGLLWVIGTFTSAYHNYYLSEVWDVVRDGPFDIQGGGAGIFPRNKLFFSLFKHNKLFLSKVNRNKFFYFFEKIHIKIRKM